MLAGGKVASGVSLFVAYALSFCDMSSKESYCPQILSIGAVTRAVTRAVLIQERHLQNH